MSASDRSAPRETEESTGRAPGRRGLGERLQLRRRRAAAGPDVGAAGSCGAAGSGSRRTGVGMSNRTSASSALISSILCVRAARSVEVEAARVDFRRRRVLETRAASEPLSPSKSAGAAGISEVTQWPRSPPPCRSGSSASAGGSSAPRLEAASAELERAAGPRVLERLLAGRTRGGSGSTPNSSSTKPVGTRKGARRNRPRAGAPQRGSPPRGIPRKCASPSAGRPARGPEQDSRASTCRKSCCESNGFETIASAPIRSARSPVEGLERAGRAA